MKVFNSFSLSKNILPDFINNWSVAQKVAVITSIALTAILAVAAVVYFYINRKPSGGPPPGGGPGGGGGVAHAPSAATPYSQPAQYVQPNQSVPNYGYSSGSSSSGSHVKQPAYQAPAPAQPAYGQPWQGGGYNVVQPQVPVQHGYNLPKPPRKQNQDEIDLVASQLQLQELDQEVRLAKIEYEEFQQIIEAKTASALQTPPVVLSDDEDEEDKIDPVKKDVKQVDDKQDQTDSTKKAVDNKEGDQSALTKKDVKAKADDQSDQTQKDVKKDSSQDSEKDLKPTKKKSLPKELDLTEFDKDQKELTRLKGVVDKKFTDFKKHFRDYLEDLSSYIHGCVKGNKAHNDSFATAQSKNANFDKERSHTIFGHVVTFTGLITAHSEDQAFLQESLFQIDDFLEKTFFTDPNKRCLNEKMKMDLIVFQEFFILLNKFFDQIQDPQLAQRLKIKLANFPLNDCGVNATLLRSNFPKIFLSEQDQINIMIEHFQSLQHPQRDQAIELFRKISCVPRWYHATKQQYFSPIITSRQIEVLHRQAFNGAWISNRWETSFGSYIFVFDNNITQIDGGKVFIGYEKGETNWRGLQQPIPLVDHLVYVGIDYYQLSRMNEYVTELRNIGIQNPVIISNQLLQFVQQETIKVLGNPNLNANWWGAADYKHLEITPAGIADTNDTYKG